MWRTELSTAFVAACEKFTYLDVLKTESDEPPTASQAMRVDPATTLVHVQPPRKTIDKAALNELGIAITNVASDSADWANLADVGHYLSKISPDLNARNYGYQRLRDFVQATDITETRWKHMGDTPPVCLVRSKSTR